MYSRYSGEHVSLVQCVQRQTRNVLTRGRTDHYWRLVLLTYSLPFSSAFHPNCRKQFFTLTFCRKKNIFLPWPWTLTYDLDLEISSRYSHVGPSRQLSRSKVISFDSYRAVPVLKRTVYIIFITLRCFTDSEAVSAAADMLIIHKDRASLFRAAAFGAVRGLASASPNVSSFDVLSNCRRAHPVQPSHASKCADPRVTISQSPTRFVKA